MAFQLKVDALEYKKIPPGTYDFKLSGFKPDWSKDKKSINFNAQMEIVNHPELDGAKFFEGLNSKAGFMQVEICHSLGVLMEDMGNGQYVMPGIWDGDTAAFKEDDPSTWKYEGPLVGRTGKVEIGSYTYNGTERSGARQYLCALSDGKCATQFGKDKHNKDLLAKRK